MATVVGVDCSVVAGSKLTISENENWLCASLALSAKKSASREWLFLWWSMRNPTSPSSNLRTLSVCNPHPWMEKSSNFIIFYFQMVVSNHIVLFMAGKFKIRGKKLGRQSIDFALLVALFHFSCHCFDFRRCTYSLGQSESCHWHLMVVHMLIS
jgi:hypothetical protein